MEQCGEFAKNIGDLEESLKTVRSVWTDKTATTFDQINENMKFFVTQITAHQENSIAGYDAVKANYNETDFESELSALGAKVASL